MRMIKIGTILPALWGVLFCAAGQAFADDCENIGSNPTWQNGIQKIQDNLKAENYDAVIESAKPLFAICGISPSLMYYTGTALEKKGETDRALVYYQKASENLTLMAADAGISRQIWYKRYELENPDRTEASVAEKDAKIADLEAKYTALEKTSAVSSSEIAGDSNKKYETIMWTGTGIGLGGLVLAGTGIGLALKNKKSDLLEHGNNGLKIKTSFIGGWALIGTGLGLTLAGAAMAGIGGYHYAKTKDDAVMLLTLNPTGASFAMTF